MLKKRTTLILMVLITMVLMSGCYKLEAGIIINENGSGEVYSKALMAEEFSEDGEEVDNEFFSFSETAKTKSIKETIDGELYIGDLITQEFNGLNELTQLTQDSFKITENDNIITLEITSSAIEESNPGEQMDDQMLILMKESMDAKFKITVPGTILEATGLINGNTVTWDLLENNQNGIMMLKYKKPAGQPSIPPVKPIVPVKPISDIIKVTINGIPVNFVDQNPVIVNERTLVPIRMISEELGMEVEWDNITRTAKIFNDEKQILLTIGEKEVTTYHELNKKIITLDVPAQIINGRTMVPLRAISEILDIQVDWDQSTKTAVLTK